MQEQFKPGDRVVWYRYNEKIIATVLKLTPNRVKIESYGYKAEPIISHIKPENLQLLREVPEIGAQNDLKSCPMCGSFSLRRNDSPPESWLCDSCRKTDEGLREKVRRNRYKYVKEALRRGLNGKYYQKSVGENGQESSEQAYTFQIPLEDGNFYLRHSVSTELSKRNYQLLQSEAKVNDLVSQITKDFDAYRYRQEQLFPFLDNIIDNWPVLVALGGKIVPTLLASAEKSDNITSLALISRLLGDIARDTTHRLSKRSSVLLCEHCFVYFAAHKMYLPWIKTSIIYYGCRSCGQSRRFMEYEGNIIAVLNTEMEKCDLRDGLLRVNWLSHRKSFDFDEVEIIQASDEDVERFVIQTGNDTDKSRSFYTQTSCLVTTDCHLSENTMKILHRMFGHVIVDKATKA